MPFDNTLAKLDVRNVKTKMSGCFRTEDGAQNYLDVISYLSTGIKHGFSVFNALTATFAGNENVVLQKSPQTFLTSAGCRTTLRHYIK